LRFESNQTFVNSLIHGTKYFLVAIVTSVLIGYFFGYITAFILSKLSGKVKDIHKYEIGIMLILPWVSYLITEVIF
jgi:NhaP-type Na+/H+ or K+/H+ antiporter